VEVPRLADLLHENKTLVCIVVILISLGFYLGTKAEFQQIILEEAEKKDVASFRNVPLTTISIWSNNVLVALLASFGVIEAFRVAIFSVGVVYGALFATMSGASFLTVLFTFGVLELFAAFLAIFAGLLFFKYFFLKLKREQASLIDTIMQAFFVFLVSIGLLFPSAVIEASLLYSANFNRQMLGAVVLAGGCTSFLLIYLLLRRRY